jgi:hypothetical protein
MTDRLFKLAQQIERLRQQAQAGFSEAASYEEDNSLQSNRLLALQQSLSSVNPSLFNNNYDFSREISNQFGQDQVKDKREENEKKVEKSDNTYELSNKSFFKVEEMKGVDIGFEVNAVMRLKFIPHSSVFKNNTNVKVGLIQTVMIQEKRQNTQDIEAAYADESLHPYTAYKKDKNTHISIDRQADNNPVYGTTTGEYGKLLTDNEIKLEKCKSPEKQKEAQELMGEKGHIASYKWRTVTLVDSPARSKAGKAEILMKFEVVALILNGEETGTCLGSLHWGWQWKRLDGKITFDKILVDTQPSPDFFKAAEAWNRCDDDTVKSCDHDLYGLIHITKLVNIPLNKKS